MSFPKYNFNGEEVPPSKLKRLKRATADRLLQEILDRAAAYNIVRHRLLWVEEIKVFGSYLTESPTLGDVDVALRYSRKPTWSSAAAIRQAEEEGPESLLYLEKICWPEIALKRWLRSRSGYISIHEQSEIDDLNCPVRTVFVGDFL